MTVERDDLQTKLEQGRCFTKAEVFRLKGPSLSPLLAETALTNACSRVRRPAAPPRLGPRTLYRQVGPATPPRPVRRQALPRQRTRRQRDLLPRPDRARDETQRGRHGVPLCQSRRQHRLGPQRGSRGTKSRAPSSSPSLLLPWARANERFVQSILNRIAGLWTSSRRLRREISLVHLRFPTTCRVYKNEESGQDVLRVQAEVHVPRNKATFVVGFELTGEELVTEEERRPAELEAVVQGIGCEVEVIFGSVE